MIFNTGAFIFTFIVNFGYSDIWKYFVWLFSIYMIFEHHFTSRVKIKLQKKIPPYSSWLTRLTNLCKQIITDNHIYVPFIT